jgi:hypothetical protein
MSGVVADKSENTIYFVHIDDTSSESKCGQCIEMKRQLKEVLMELSCAQLIIKLLQKEINVSTSSVDSTIPVSTKGDFQEDSNENDWTLITYKHYNKARKPTNCNACRASPIRTTNQYALVANLKETSAIGDADTVTKKQELHITNDSYATEFWQSSLLKDLRNGKHIDHLDTTKHSLRGRLERHRNGDKELRYPIATIVNGKISPSNSVDLVIRDGKETKNLSSGPSVYLRSYKNMSRKEHKIFILGDSHSRKCAANVRTHISDNFETEGLVKPGSGTDILVTSARIYQKRDVIVFSGGANDIGKNNPKEALKRIVDFITLNNHTNIILLSISHRHDLSNSSNEQ